MTGFRSKGRKYSFFPVYLDSGKSALAIGFLSKPIVDAAFLFTVGSFLLTVEPLYLQLTILAFYLQLALFHLQNLAFLVPVGVLLLAVGKCV